LIVTIDGPSAAGKSTAARELARRLGWRYLDSGLTYRAVGWAALETGTGLDDENAARQLMAQTQIALKYRRDEPRVLVNGQDVTELVRTPEISEAASAISRFPFVRKKVVAVQREAGRTKDLVAEGRDMGTVVFPEAEVKFFLHASPEVRAERRLRDWSRMRIQADYASVLAELLNRDNRDTTREASPLRPARDAITIDTSDLTIEQVLEVLLRKTRERCDEADMV